MRTPVVLGAAACLVGSLSVATAQETVSRAQAAAALNKAVTFYTTKVSTEGGFLWRYSSDLSKREGESKADEHTVWVQPAGTPSVGTAFLEGYQRTSEASLLGAAKRAAHALVRGQLISGGWDYRIVFDERGRKNQAYRVDGGEVGKRNNVTTFDDNTTQEAMRLLMRIDKELEFKDPAIHEASLYALSNVLKAQYPNGAWPQRYSTFPDPKEHSVLKASYPDSWPREWPNVKYNSFYTFNDGALADVIEVLFEATRVYREPKYARAAERGGDFILLSQMPEPQPAWAQQYDRDMHPVWARKFEPPSVTGGESQGILQALIFLYEQTGDRKYLEPIPRAIQYLRKSQLPNGQLARFYELKTNKPLYFTKDYRLVYTDDNLPTHYGFKVSHRLDRIQEQFERASKMAADQLERRRNTKPPTFTVTDALKKQVRDVVKAQDERGAWVDDGKLSNHGAGDSTDRIIDTRTLIRNVDILTRYLAATR